MRYEEGRRETVIQGPSLQETAEGAKEKSVPMKNNGVQNKGLIFT